MSILNKSYKISASVVIAGLLMILTVASLIGYLVADNSDGKWGGLLGSLTAGLIVAIIQFLFAWQDYAQTEKLKKLKLIEILYNRSARDKYTDYIKNCNRELDVMGVTAVRFFNDFADTSTQAPEDATVLLKALDRKVHVRVLLPSDDFIPEQKKMDSAKVRAKLKELHQYQNLEIRYFNHTAAHSIFRIDDTCIIGPVFPELESRNTPALHVMSSSPMAVNYLDYFESEWENAEKL